MQHGSAGFPVTSMRESVEFTAFFFFLSSRASKQMFSGSLLPTLQQPTTVSVSSHLMTFEPGNHIKALAPTTDSHLLCHWRGRMLTEVATCDHSGSSHQCFCWVLCVMCALVHAYTKEPKVKQESRSLKRLQTSTIIWPARSCTDVSISYVHKLYHHFLCFYIFKTSFI